MKNSNPLATITKGHSPPRKSSAFWGNSANYHSGEKYRVTQYYFSIVLYCCWPSSPQIKGTVIRSSSIWILVQVTSLDLVTYTNLKIRIKPNKWEKIQPKHSVGETSRRQICINPFALPGPFHTGSKSRHLIQTVPDHLGTISMKCQAPPQGK